MSAMSSTLLIVPFLTQHLKLLLGQQPFKPARMSAGLHSHTYLLPACRESAMELPSLLAMRQSFFLKLSGVSIHQSNLLKLGVKIYSYNDHCSAPFARALWLVCASKVYSVLGADIVYGIMTLIDP